MHEMMQKHSRALSVFFVIFGGVFLLRELGVLSDNAASLTWPILFVLLGLYLWAQKG